VPQESFPKTLDEETKLLDAVDPRFQRFVRFALARDAASTRSGAST
jgi:hypothetical protein